jgi:hypothetical protein
MKREGVLGESQEEGIVPCSCCFFHSSYLSTWRLCHQPHSITPNKGIETISIDHIIHIRYSSVVFRSFAEAKRPITINIPAPAKPAVIIIYWGISPRNTLPKNSNEKKSGFWGVKTPVKRKIALFYRQKCGINLSLCALI